jgi:citrate lyase beta subunit
MHEQLMGASLYVPTTRDDLVQIASGERLAAVRSLIFCTEDAVAAPALETALANLATMLRQLSAANGRERYVRVRDASVLAQVLAMPGADRLDGFVIPKATRHTLGAYLCQLEHTGHKIMPTLETVEVFDDGDMRLLREYLQACGFATRIPALRIGGNDLLALLGIRRPRNLTIYQTPLGQVIARLVTTFRPYGFRLTAPVFEYLKTPELLAEEVLQDLAFGMVGKTAIHPDQVPMIEQHYRVRPIDVMVARRIVAQDSPAVFKMDDAMCEVATHLGWARAVIEQARHFGTQPADALQA